MTASSSNGDARDVVADRNRAPRPRLLIFDVNETLSDMRPMADRFRAVGAPGELAVAWFSGLLRDGFALTVTGLNRPFADLAVQSLRVHLRGVTSDVDAAIQHVMAGFAALPAHPDVVDGVRELRALELELVTLSNGAATVAEGLLERNGISDCFARVLSVEDAPLWKPAAAAYGFALQTCGVDATEAMLVAVHPWDIHGAHQAGLSTAWIDREGGYYPSCFARPDLRASSIVDLAAQLSQNAS